jgi:hypothetical protein
MLIPGPEGTKLKLAADVTEVRWLLDNGMNVADAVLPHTEPKDAVQLELFPL